MTSVTSLAWVLMDKSVKKLLARENSRGAGSSLVLAGWLFIRFQGNFVWRKQDTHERQCPSVLARSRVAQLELEQEWVWVRQMVASVTACVTSAGVRMPFVV